MRTIRCPSPAAASTALDLVGYTGFVLAAYFLGGRGPAAAVAGVCLLLVSYTVASGDRPVRKVTRFRFVRDAGGEQIPGATFPRPQGMITNETFAQMMQERPD